MINTDNTYVNNIKYRFLLAISILVFLAGTIMYLYQYNLLIQEEKHDIDITHTYIHDTYELLMGQLNKDLLMHSQILLRSKQIKEALFKHNRLKLQELVKPSFKLLQKDNPYLKIMTFRLDDGTALLRLHRPDMYGDTLHEGRKIVIETNRDHTFHSGFEVGKLKMTYRLLTPVFLQDTYIGSLEIGVEPEFIIESLKKISHFEYALLVQSEYTQAAQDLKVLGETKEYYMLKGSPLFINKLHEIDIDKDDEEITSGKHHYLIKSNFFLKDHTDKKIARFLIAYNTDPFIQKTERLLYDTFYFISITLILLILILRTGFNYFISRFIKAKQELQTLNQELESRVKEEVDKNRMQEQQMLHQSRLAQMGELMSMIAHQWRQPLASINAIQTNITLRLEMNAFDLSTTQGQEDMSDYTKEHLAKIEKTVIGLSHTIDDFKDFYKPSQKKSIYPLHEPIDKACALIQASFKRHEIQLKTNFDESLKFNFHLNEMTQVILNLLQNSIDEFLEHKTDQASISLRTYQDDNNALKIEICDNGQGVDEEIADKIFEPYFSTKTSKNGSGLGLYMSKMIIEGHHSGSFHLHQEKGTTCFVISFPQ